ncbi:MAG: hypothetical protein K9M56_05185 [Victivallales bacterium]|nr:hypothetical protein [Victivallales bacterium]
MDSLQASIVYISNNWRIIFNPTFQKGLLAGAVLIVLVIIILKILYLIFRSRDIKCSGITGKDETGNIFVSTSAISDLVKSLEPEFSQVFITKTQLYRKRKNYYLKLTAELNDKEVDFPNLVENIRNKILHSIKNNLGVESIQKVDIHLRRFKG